MRLNAVAILTCALLLSDGRPARAFSLLGPYAPWMTTNIGYSLPGDIGGPVEPGEGYRWNIPVITYGFDQSFIDYFGPYGVKAVDDALKVLNDINDVDAITNGPPGDVNVYLHGASAPVSSKGVNFQAQTLNLMDLKSVALSAVLEQMGLAAPERHIFTLRNRQANSSYTNYEVVIRNYDPISVLPSSVVNGALYTYHIYDTTGQPISIPYADAVEDLVDPLSSSIFSSVAGALDTSSPLGSGIFNPGEFLTNLTRDDFGGLRYLLSRSRTIVENLLPDVHGWPDPTNFVNVAARPGIGSFTFQKLDRNSLSHEFTTVTNRYTDYYYLEGDLLSQTLERVVHQPDILFTTQDATGKLYDRSGTSGWKNNASLNGTGYTEGPGVIQPPVSIAFNRTLPAWINLSPGFLNEVNVLSRLSIWGSFDGSTNAPVYFPTPPVPAPGLSLSSVASVEASTQVTLQFTLAPRLNYVLQSSADLRTWVTLTNFDNAPASLQFLDTRATNFNPQFYRILFR